MPNARLLKSRGRTDIHHISIFLRNSNTKHAIEFGVPFLMNEKSKFTAECLSVGYDLDVKELIKMYKMSVSQMDDAKGVYWIVVITTLYKYCICTLNTFL